MVIWPHGPVSMKLWPGRVVISLVVWGHSSYAPSNTAFPCRAVVLPPFDSWGGRETFLLHLQRKKKKPCFMLVRSHVYPSATHEDQGTQTLWSTPTGTSVHTSGWMGAVGILPEIEWRDIIVQTWPSTIVLSQRTSVVKIRGQGRLLIRKFWQRSQYMVDGYQILNEWQTIHNVVKENSQELVP